MNSSLNWNPERGFELDLDLEHDGVVLAMSGMPVPADGTKELSKGVELHRLDVLFKSQATVEGEPGQVHECTVTLKGDKLRIDAKVEDVETGEIARVQVTIDANLPRGVPESGGPRPVPEDEDELDWEDETTLEKMVVEPGDRTPGPAPTAGEPSAKGLQALLRALVEGPELTDEADLPSDDVSEEEPPAAPEPAKRAASGARSPVDDQSMSPEGEALALVELLIHGDNLELEEDFEARDLVEGVVGILAMPFSAERKAGMLSEWLLDQDAVADLYIGDDDLAQILEQW